LNSILLGPGFRDEKWKTVSFDQYCRYPANCLNCLGLEARGSRDFRFRRGTL